MKVQVIDKKKGFTELWLKSYDAAQDLGRDEWAEDRVRKAIAKTFPVTGHQFKTQWVGGNKGAGIFIAAVSENNLRAVVRGAGRNVQILGEAAK